MSESETHPPAADPAPPPGDPLLDGGFATLATHYGEHRLLHAGAAAPPIYQTSTFVHADADSFERRGENASRGYDYTRMGNPTNAILEAKIARLERGTWARGFGSGMGAITAAINACLSGGTHAVAVRNCYGPTRTYLEEHLKRFGVTTTFVSGLDTAEVLAAFRPETKLLYLESPTSGVMEVPEIAPLTAAARQRGIVTVFDNSWASPYFQNPLEQGADLVVHSATKYIGGHSDVVAGLVAGRDEELRVKVLREAELVGATLDPFAAWLLLRGLRTLALRMEQHQKSGLAIARWLAQHPLVRSVNHPGLETHPQYALARRQLRGYSGLFSFEPRTQTHGATHSFMNRLRLFSIGVSWGGHESLVVGGNFFGRDEKQQRWVIRLHCGLENTEDLLEDVRQALEGT